MSYKEKIVNYSGLGLGTRLFIDMAEERWETFKKFGIALTSPDKTREEQIELRNSIEIQVRLLEISLSELKLEDVSILQKGEPIPYEDLLAARCGQAIDFLRKADAIICAEIKKARTVKANAL